MDQQICPVCKTINPAAAYFCLQCGKKLKEPPVSTTVAKQILIYSISFFLPPFGLSWAFKYLKQSDEKAKIIGWISIILTIISIGITVWITWSFMQSYANLLNELSTGNVSNLQDNQMLQQLKLLQQ